MFANAASTAALKAFRAIGHAGRFRRLAGGLAIAFVLAGCQADEISYGSGPKHLRAVSQATKAKMSELAMAETAPVLMRIFKEESAFEVWKMDRSGRYQLLKEYEICKWSGELGPKVREGDRQAPEGYYKITPGLMNPNSSYYLSFDTGYPNSYDRSHGRTGSNLMVHGACSSRGCYAMTDAQIQEIYALARDAFRGGQRGFQLAAYPFRMTPENMARHIDSPHMPFWRMLKEGYDHFELTRREPKVDVCGRKYVFDSTADGPMSPMTACPGLVQPEEIRIAASKKAAEDDAKTMVIVARLAEEKKAAEEKEILIAAREEERGRLAEERRVALAERKEAIANLFGLADDEAAAPDASVASVPETVVAQLPAAAEDGSPLPRPAPGRSPDPVLALAPAPAPTTSMFGRLFSFGDEERPVSPAAADAAVAEAPAAETAPTQALPGVTAVASAEPLSVPANAACASDAGDVDGADCAAASAPAAAAVSDENQSILNRIGNWF